MTELSEKNNLAYALSNELVNTTDKFLEEHPETDLRAILNAGNLYIADYLVPARLTAKQRAERIKRFLQRLELCRAKRFKEID